MENGGGNMQFRDVLLHYFSRLCNIKLNIERKYKTLHESSAELYTNLIWFQFVRDRAFRLEEIFEEINDENILNDKAFLLPEDKRYPGCEDGKPYKVIKYRNIYIPIYDDDYGQQDFAIVNGKEISGGCFNLFSYQEFIDAVDCYLQESYLKDEYDMNKELSALFPESEEDK